MTKLDDITPVGVNLDNILKFYVVLLGISIATSFDFFDFCRLLHSHRLDNANAFPQKELFTSFWENIGFFPCIFLWCILLGFYHYFYHFQGSKSIYLMRRLPQKGEFTKRIIALPIALFCLTFLLIIVYMLLYFQIFLIFYENQNYEGNLWEIIIQTILKGD